MHYYSWVETGFNKGYLYNVIKILRVSLQDETAQLFIGYVGL